MKQIPKPLQSESNAFATLDHTEIRVWILDSLGRELNHVLLRWKGTRVLVQSFFRDVDVMIRLQYQPTVTIHSFIHFVYSLNEWITHKNKRTCKKDKQWAGQQGLSTNGYPLKQVNKPYKTYTNETGNRLRYTRDTVKNLTNSSNV